MEETASLLHIHCRLYADIDNSITGQPQGCFKHNSSCLCLHRGAAFYDHKGFLHTRDLGLKLLRIGSTSQARDVVFFDMCVELLDELCMLCGAFCACTCLPILGVKGLLKLRKYAIVW